MKWKFVIRQNSKNFEHFFDVKIDSNFKFFEKISCLWLIVWGLKYTRMRQLHSIEWSALAGPEGAWDSEVTYDVQMIAHDSQLEIEKKITTSKYGSVSFWLKFSPVLFAPAFASSVEQLRLSSMESEEPR